MSNTPGCFTPEAAARAGPSKSRRDTTRPSSASQAAGGITPSLASGQVFLRVDRRPHRIKQLWLEGTSGGYNPIFCSTWGCL